MAKLPLFGAGEGKLTDGLRDDKPESGRMVRPGHEILCADDFLLRKKQQGIYFEKFTKISGDDEARMTRSSAADLLL